MVVLKAKESVVKGAGIARINTSVAKELRIKARETIELRKNDKFLYLMAVVDNMIPKNEVSVRVSDLASLGAVEGEELAVTKVISAKALVKKRIEKAKVRAKKVGVKVKKRIEKAKKKLKKITKKK